MIIVLSSIEAFCYFIYNIKLVRCVSCKSCQHHVFVNSMIMNKIFVNCSFLESPELKDKLLIYFETFIFLPKFNGLFYYFYTYNILLFLLYLMECILCRIQHYIVLSSMLDSDVSKQKT